MNVFSAKTMGILEVKWKYARVKNMIGNMIGNNLCEIYELTDGMNIDR